MWQCARLTTITHVCLSPTACRGQQNSCAHFDWSRGGSMHTMAGKDIVNGLSLGVCSYNCMIGNRAPIVIAWVSRHAWWQLWVLGGVASPSCSCRPPCTAQACVLAAHACGTPAAHWSAARGISGSGPWCSCSLHVCSHTLCQACLDPAGAATAGLPSKGREGHP